MYIGGYKYHVAWTPKYRFFKIYCVNGKYESFMGAKSTI